MDRTETTIVRVAPEKRQAAIRKQQGFGWTFVSAQEDTELAGGQSSERVKLLFTRTASSEWADAMKLLERELEQHDASVRFGSDKLVILGDDPPTSLPIPIVIVIMFAGYLVGWVVFGMIGGIGFGAVSVGVSWLLYRNRGMKKLQQHTATRRKATETFHKKRQEILTRVRVHVRTRETILQP